MPSCPCQSASTRLRRACLHGAPLLLPCFLLALWVYSSLLPDHGGAGRCARELGWNPQDYGAHFSPQYLMNGTMLWETRIYRYRMSPADYARMKADMLADGWTFHGNNSDGILGTVAGKFYVDVLEDNIELAYPGRLINGDSWCMNYNHTDGNLYIEDRFGS